MKPAFTDSSTGYRYYSILQYEQLSTILELRQNADPEIAALADYVYEHVFVHYTMKQWGQTPEEIDPNTTARVPVFLSEDCRYFQDVHQACPGGIPPPCSSRMLDHPNHHRGAETPTPPPACAWRTAGCIWTGRPLPAR